MAIGLGNTALTTRPRAGQQAYTTHE